MNSSWDVKAVGGVNGGGLSLGETSSGEGRTGGAAAALIRLRCHVSLCAVSLPFVILQISVLQIWATLHWQPLQFAASPFFFFSSFSSSFVFLLNCSPLFDIASVPFRFSAKIKTVSPMMIRLLINGYEKFWPRKSFQISVCGSAFEATTDFSNP